MKTKNPNAVALGRRAAGKPKNYSKAEVARRKKRLALGRAKRWLAHASVNVTARHYNAGKL